MDKTSWPPSNTKKIWGFENIIETDGVLPEPPPGGEIHPDLIRYKGYWYCGLKERGLPSRAGGSRIIRSRDGDQWESVKFIEWRGGGLTDLKFSITSEGALMLHTMVTNWKYRDYNVPLRPDRPETGPVKRMSVTWLTTDGVDWGTLHGCPSGLHTTRYDVTWHDGMGYSIGYGQKDEPGTLYRTHDGKSWHVLATNLFDSWSPPKIRLSDLSEDDQRLQRDPGRGTDPNDETQAGAAENWLAPKQPNEAALAFDPDDGTAIALVRTHPVFAILGTAKAPFYEEWTWRQTQVDRNGDDRLCPSGEKLGVQMGGPMMTRLSDGRLIAAGRADASTKREGRGRLTLFIVDVENAVLRRFGDFDGWSHYPGVVEYEGRLWISCGRQQRPDQFGVYLLKAPLPG